ncbi:MAG: FUSC family protein [Bacteroidetes bacterium]|nr:FUSC family protein [Bacteroidota bacterium]
MRYFNITSTGISYAIRIWLGCGIVWWSLYYLHDSKKIWAMISVIVVSDPDFGVVRTTTISRVVNTLVGCALGLVFVYLFNTNVWSLMAAITLSVIISTSFRNFPTSWKLAPTTVLIVMMPAVAEHASWKEAMILALTRSAEILYGSLVAFVLGYIFVKVKEKYDLSYEKQETEKQNPSGDHHE